MNRITINEREYSVVYDLGYIPQVYEVYKRPVGERLYRADWETSDMVLNEIAKQQDMAHDEVVSQWMDADLLELEDLQQLEDYTSRGQ